MNIVVHVSRGIEEHGYEYGTRQAWKCGKRAHDVNRVIGVVKGRIVCVIENVYAALSTPDNNPSHNQGANGRYIFLGGALCHEKDAAVTKRSTLMGKKVTGLGQNFTYLTDEALAIRLASE